MKKSKVAVLICMGIACLAFLLGSIWYSLSFNEGRLVYPTELSAYAFQTSDLPMLLSVCLFAAYVLFLAVTLIYNVLRARQSPGAANRARRMNPKWGLLGFLGFLGFAGIWTYQSAGQIFPFAFFLFFGFFGFYFEGKLSGAFMDERFRENAQRAQLTAYKTGFICMFLLLLVVGGRVFVSLEITAIVFTAGTALILALVLFLSEYLLYRYDQGGQPDGEEED